MKVFILFLIAIVFAGAVSAQSPFKAEPKPYVNPFARDVVSRPIYVNAWRFTGNISAYNYTFSKGAASSSDLIGAEYGYEHQKYDTATKGYDVVWSVNAAWFPINTAAPVSIANMQTFGATFGFKNPLPIGNSVIQVGPDYNFHAPKGQQFGVLATIGILFN